MSANRDQEEEIFDAARELAGDERSAYLAERCGQDGDLRQRIEGMLAADAAAGEFFETRAVPSPTVVLSATGLSPSMEKVGDRIGRYKLLQQIGEGGMGVVYMAEQSEPVRRSVALKIIKLGMDTRQVVARFEAERQALAMMSHPHIAKVFDAGVTDSGRPYFVMELVRGIPITEYCDKNFLPTRERLDLFILVCQAVQHAHQKGVIHRDLKPSNILVTLHDGVPWPMVIDFGIAKATNQRLTEKTLFTGFGQMIGTPAYMSPEQAEMSKLDVDTRTDIYALGVLLYELLTGTTPFPTKELLSLGYREMQRTIAEREPLHLSARLSTMANEERTVVAKNRSVEVSALAKLFRGDLDWIATKCLEKDRTRRYETANGLASDIQRHLNNEPVVARPPSQRYRFEKLVRRNKLAFASSAIIAALLVGGAVISTWQAVRATRAERGETRLRKEAEHARSEESAHRQRAEAEKARSEEVARFLTEMLEGVGPALAKGRDTQMLREILDRTANRIAGLENQPQAVAEIRSTLGTTYLNLGEPLKAETMQRDALRLREMLFGATNKLTARTMTDLSRALISRKPREAESLARKAVALWPQIKDAEPADIALSQYVLASALLWHEDRSPEARLENRSLEAEALFRRVVETRKAVYGTEHLEVALALGNLALALRHQGKAREAETTLLEALRMPEKLGHEHPDIAWTLQLLAQGYVTEGRLTDAEAAYRKVADLRRKVLPNDHVQVSASILQEAKLLCRLRRHEEAAEWFGKLLAVAEAGNRWAQYSLGNHYFSGNCVSKDYGEAVRLFRKSAAQDHPPAQLVLARMYAIGRGVEKNQTEAANWLQKCIRAGEPSTLNDLAWNLATSPESDLRDGTFAIALAEKAAAATSRTNALHLDTLAAAYAQAGQFTNAVSTQQEALALLSTNEQMNVVFERRIRLFQSNTPYRDHGELATRVNNLLTEGKFVEAEPLARECLTLREKQIPNEWRTFNAKSMLGGALLGQQKLAEAEPLLRAGYEGMKQRQAEMAGANVRLIEALQRLVRLYEARGEPDQAALWRQKLTEFDHPTSTNSK